jgi:Nucleotide modification associated domain 1
MKSPTIQQYQDITAYCQKLFAQKHQDYGSAWRIMRLPTITDQIYIKAKRIRTIQETGEQKVGDDIASEFVGIINYCIIALIQMELQAEEDINLPYSRIGELYQKKVAENQALLEQKNHDYGEAWRELRISSMTDLILMKLQRVKQIEDNSGQTVISEGIAANYQDILNYAVFCLILMDFLSSKS